MWLRDLLPEKLPGCRVMSFQYDASVTSMAVGTIRDVANNLVELLMDEREDPVSTYMFGPIVLIYCHCEGITYIDSN
jgi:hypothetical protein